jgi:Cobalamin synthesis protein cobW C-terminal domain
MVMAQRSATRPRAVPIGDAVDPARLATGEGILAFADRPGERAVFQLVGKRKELKLEAGSLPAESMLVAIARKNAFDLEALTARFDACRIDAQRR